MWPYWSECFTVEWSLRPSSFEFGTRFRTFGYSSTISSWAVLLAMMIMDQTCEPVSQPQLIVVPLLTFLGQSVFHSDGNSN